MVSTPPSPGVVAVLPSPHLAPVCVVPVWTQRRLRVYSASQHHRPTPRRKLLSKPTLRMQNARYAGELLVWLATHTHTHTQRHTHTHTEFGADGPHGDATGTLAACSEPV